MTVLKLVDAEFVAQQAAPMPEFQHRGLSLRELRTWFLMQYAAPLELSTRRNYERALTLACDGRAATKGKRGKGQVDALPELPTPRDVARWLSQMQTAGYASTTIHLHRTSMVHAFEAGSTCGKTWGNPFAVVPWRKGVPLRAPLYDVRGTWAFLASSDVLTLRERAFVAVLRFTGLRKGEALGLEWRHVDFARGRLHVDQQRRTANSRKVSRKLKSEAARRWVPMRAELVDTLRELRREGLTHEIRCGLGGGKREVTPLLFPWGEHQLSRILDVLRGVDAGFPRGDAWHVFRHTCAVELWRAGKTEAFIQEWLGHASLEKTAVYLRSLDGRRISAEEVAGLDPDYRPREVTGARSMRLAAHEARTPRSKKKETAAPGAAGAAAPVLTGALTPAVVAVPPAAPAKERRMKTATPVEAVKPAATAALPTATATADTRESVSELRKLGAQAHEVGPSSSSVVVDSLSSSSAGVRGAGGDSKLPEPVEKCAACCKVTGECVGLGIGSDDCSMCREHCPRRREGRSEAEAVAPSEVASVEPDECSECGGRFTATPADAMPVCPLCRARNVKAAMVARAAVVGAVAVAEVASLPFVCGCADCPEPSKCEGAPMAGLAEAMQTRREEEQAAERSRDFAKAELVKLARRGESLAVQLAQFDADHAEEVLGFLGALTDSMEQGPGAATPMITMRLRKSRAEVSVLTRGAQRLEAECAKATTRATAAEFKLNAARELLAMREGSAVLRLERQREETLGQLEAERDEVVKLKAERAAAWEEREASAEREKKALARVVELEGLLRESVTPENLAHPSPELRTRIEQAVRS